VKLAGPRVWSVFVVVALVQVGQVVGCGGVSTPGGDGGRAGTGGATGAAGTGGAGTTGAGGATGAAGTGGAGTTDAGGHGSGGTGGAGAGHDGGADGGTSCDDLATQYATALVAASACTVGGASQCAVMVSSSLSPCFVGCMTFVQDATPLGDLKARWMTAGCDSQVTVCPAIACLNPSTATCAPSDGGAGRCVSAAAFSTN
jgi:hypothetical protein